MLLSLDTYIVWTLDAYRTTGGFNWYTGDPSHRCASYPRGSNSTLQLIHSTGTLILVSGLVGTGVARIKKTEVFLEHLEVIRFYTFLVLWSCREFWLPQTGVGDMDIFFVLFYKTNHLCERPTVRLGYGWARVTNPVTRRSSILLVLMRPRHAILVTVVMRSIEDNPWSYVWPE